MAYRDRVVPSPVPSEEPGREEANSSESDEIREAVVALTEMRGFVTAGTGRERDFMLPRIDRCLDIIGGDIGLARIVRNIQHNVMEGNRG